MAVAYGLIKQKAHVILLDSEEPKLTASRGNFGLVWVQGKGLGMPRYAEWSLEASQEWPEFSGTLQNQTGIDLSYHKTGGLEFCLGKQELQARRKVLKQMSLESRTGRYESEILNRTKLQDLLPKIELGPQVSGASFCPHDGHVNPLRLLQALHLGFQGEGGRYSSGQMVQRIEPSHGSFGVQTETHHFHCAKVVIACGLGTVELAKNLGMEIPLKPERGQVLITEKTRKVLPCAAVTIRQTDDGRFMLGGSHEDVGYDLDTSHEILKNIAQHGVRVFPCLADLKLIRSWAALRVLTPDKHPIYIESDAYPGAFAVTTHSGITLASLHAKQLPLWILEDEAPPEFEQFHPERFRVPQAA